MIKLTWGQTTVLVAASLPMAVVGFAGGAATFVNMNHVLHRGWTAAGLVAAGEGATLICALVSLAVTLMGQHTPGVARLGMWLIPLVAAATGVALAPTGNEAVVMAVTPMAMTAAGEGISFVARRVVAYRTGIDIEQQRRSGLLLWHANRAANGSGLGKKISTAAVWRLTKQVAATDGQLSVQLGDIQRYRIGEGADANLFAVLSGGEKAAVRPSLPSVAPAASLPPAVPFQAVSEPLTAAASTEPLTPSAEVVPADSSWDAMFGEVMAEAQQTARLAPELKLMTTADVAAEKGVAVGTVRSWKYRGKLRVHDVIDGAPMFHPDDVADLD